MTVLDNPSIFGPERLGKIGYKGWFYHFLGVDGKRKINFDFPETQVDESKNTVELSTIDTGLALMGLLAAQSFFDSQDPTEVGIRNKAQSIYDRVDWNFMLESNSLQFYLGWKPNEEREGYSFDIPDSLGKGGYSGTPGKPQTLDFYTDEALIVILLGLGSATHPIPVETYCALIQQERDGLILTYPGSLFTYQFLQAFIDTRTLLFPTCERELNGTPRNF